MLHHHCPTPETPHRVVVVGARGFIGAALVRHLEREGIACLALSSADIDLAAEKAADALAARLEPEDAVVMLSALTPDKGRGAAVTLRNLRMGEAVCAALEKRPVRHVVYMSSDAVYPFVPALVNEASAVAPADLYGCMHLTREQMFKAAVKAPLAILRCTAVYGAADSHNSYGPNRFRRQAAAEGRIVLGGEGEETRDHFYIGDAVRLLMAVLSHRSAGLLNFASGRSVTFRSLAGMVAARAGRPVEIVGSPRSLPVTHRHFDVTNTWKAFPEFVFTPLERGLDLAQAGGEDA